jgi:hypothetical protein
MVQYPEEKTPLCKKYHMTDSASSFWYIREKAERGTDAGHW